MLKWKNKKVSLEQHCKVKKKLKNRGKVEIVFERIILVIELTLQK